MFKKKATRKYIHDTFAFIDNLECQMQVDDSYLARELTRELACLKHVDGVNGVSTA